MTYTRHKLTDAQLTRLSCIVKGRPHKSGTALLALYRRGLVVPSETNVWDEPNMNAPWNATALGEYALTSARHEGW